MKSFQGKKGYFIVFFLHNGNECLISVKKSGLINHISLFYLTTIYKLKKVLCSNACMVGEIAF